MDRRTDGFGYRGRKSVSDLSIRGRFATTKNPLIREPLDPRNHANCQTGKSVFLKRFQRRRIGKPHAIDTQCPPLLFRPRRAKIWSSMTL